MIMTIIIIMSPCTLYLCYKLLLSSDGNRPGSHCQDARSGGERLRRARAAWREINVAEREPLYRRVGARAEDPGGQRQEIIVLVLFGCSNPMSNFQPFRITAAQVMVLNLEECLPE